MRTVWATNCFGSVFAPAGAIGVREENCVLGPSRFSHTHFGLGFWLQLQEPVPLWQGLFEMAGRPVPKTTMRLLFVQVLLENESGSGRARQHCGVAKSDGGLGSTSSEARGARGGVCSFVFLLFCFVRCLAPVVAPRAWHSLRAMSRWSIGVANMSRWPISFVVFVASFLARSQGSRRLCHPLRLRSVLCKSMV
jgi:hypothetical protein